MDILIYIVILLFSVIIHEVMHGVAAELFGDDTARRQGRLTLNPIPHIDPFASILLPAIMLISSGGAFALGAAKPVPVDFTNMRRPRLGMAVVSLAGPLSNLAIAIVLALPATFGLIEINELLARAIFLNVVLAVFNLLPIPPLDGSKIIASVLPTNIMNSLLRYEQYGFLIILVLLFTGILNTLLIPFVALFAIVFGINL
jgi:Zn-dependent protease